MSETPRWVHVGREAALNHPRARPGPAIFVIALWFFATAAFEVWVVLALGGPVWWLGTAAIAVLTGVGLLGRVPFALVLAVLLGGRQVVGFVAGVESGLPLVFLFQAAAAVGAVFYLLEGDRPNLIYRHRYRKTRRD